MTDPLMAPLAALYGERAPALATQLRDRLAAWRARPRRASVRPPTPGRPGSEVVLIAYPDHLREPGTPPLRVLARWCQEELGDRISTVHVLPFHPSTSYEGYAITDYRAVDSDLGSWEDLEDLAAGHRLMVDLVLNHCSSSHPWVQQLRDDEEPGRSFLLTVDDPEAPWLSEVRRARCLPLTHPVETVRGTRHLWTTYSPDLVDLDWREPGLCFEMIDLLLDAVDHGAGAVRLDAYGYTWKDPGTDCVARPHTHDLLRLFQAALDEVGVGDTRLLPSVTNVTQEVNDTYLAGPGSAREADWIYHLPLAGLLLHALYAGRADRLAAWLRARPPAPEGCAHYNVCATHDGIGLTWLRDLLPEPEVQALIDGARRRGADVSARWERDGEDRRPWELNATWFSACTPDPGVEADAADRPPAGRSTADRIARDLHVAGFLLTQATVLALRGVPALYLPSFLAARNDHVRAERDRDPRAVNRARFEVAAWRSRAEDPDHEAARVLAGMRRLLDARGPRAAFHPQAPQRILDLGGDAVLAVARGQQGEQDEVLCLHEFSGRERQLSSPGQGFVRDLLDPGFRPEAPLTLAGYQVRWLVRDEARDD